MKKILKSLITVSAFAAMMVVMAFTAMAADTITPAKVTMGTEKGIPKTYSYNQNNKLNNSVYGVVVPVTITEPGAVEFVFDVVKLDKDFQVELYTDSTLKNRVVGMYTNISQGEVQKKAYVSLSTKGTYYLLVGNYAYGSDINFTNTVSITTRLFTRSDKVIKSGQTITYYRESGSDVYNFKYKAEKNGTVKVNFSYEYGSYITLLNSKKKVISNEQWASPGYKNNCAIFAVKKGSTYYFRVKSNGTSGSTAAGNGNLHTIGIKLSAIKAKGGLKKAKAATIKYNKSVKGLIAAGDKTAKWYKFTLKKGKKPAFIMNGNIIGTLKVRVMNKKGKVISTSVFNGKGKYTSYGKWKKGTYYIKVTRGNALSSGSFSIKNKQAKN